jgi:hypothetical protein
MSSIRCTIEIQIIDRNNEEPKMEVTYRAGGLGLPYTFTELAPTNVDDFATIHELILQAPDAPKWLKGKRMIDPDTN